MADKNKSKASSAALEEMDFDPSQVYEEMDFDPDAPVPTTQTPLAPEQKMVRAPSTLETARTAMLEAPQAILGTALPYLSRATGPLGAVVGSGLAAVGGAAGRAYSEISKRLPLGVRGASVGALFGPLGVVPGAIIDAVATLTAEDDI